MKRCQSFAEHGYEEGRAAYSAGVCVRDNPYDSAAYPYTDEGLAREGWHNGFRFEWVQAGLRPPESEMAPRHADPV